MTEAQIEAAIESMGIVRAAARSTTTSGLSKQSRYGGRIQSRGAWRSQRL